MFRLFPYHTQRSLRERSEDTQFPHVPIGDIAISKTLPFENVDYEFVALADHAKWGVMYSVHCRLCLGEFGGEEGSQVSALGPFLHYSAGLEIVTPCTYAGPALLVHAGQALLVGGGEKGSQPAEQLSPPSV